LEINAWNCFENKANNLIRAIKKVGENNKINYSENPIDVVDDINKVALINGDTNTVLRKIPDSFVSSGYERD